jgi:hypothetical protein
LFQKILYTRVIETVVFGEIENKEDLVTYKIAP